MKTTKQIQEIINYNLKHKKIYQDKIEKIKERIEQLEDHNTELSKEWVKSALKESSKGMRYDMNTQHFHAENHGV